MLLNSNVGQGTIIPFMGLWLIGVILINSDFKEVMTMLISSLLNSIVVEAVRK